MTDLETKYQEKLQLGFLKISIEAKLKVYKSALQEAQDNLKTAEEFLKPTYEKYIFKYQGLIEVLEDLKTNY